MVGRSLFLGADGWSYDGIHPVPSEEITKIMLDLADLQPNEKVLEIGTGSGYQTACWAETGAEVFTICRDNPISIEYPARFRSALKDGFAPIIYPGDGRKGWPYPEEFDCIILTCGVQEIPPPLISQLKENGRLIAPVGDAAGQELRRYVKQQDGKLALDRIAAGTRFVMME